MKTEQRQWTEKGGWDRPAGDLAGKAQIVLVFGGEFRGAVPFAQALLPAHAIGGFTYVAGGYLRGRKKPLVEVWSRIIGTVVMVLTVFALRERFQDLSVPLAAVCSNTTCAVLICWAVLKDVRELRRDRDESRETLATAK